MRAREIIESSRRRGIASEYKAAYINAIENFDEYIKIHGTDGANVKFNSLINATKDNMTNFFMMKEKSYHAMIEARNRLEEKIKNSGGVSYQ